MGIIADILVMFATLISTAMNGMNDVIIFDTVSLLTLIFAGAVAIDVLVFYKRATDQPASILGMGEDIYDVYMRRNPEKKRIHEHIPYFGSGWYQKRRNTSYQSDAPHNVGGRSVRPTGHMGRTYSGGRQNPSARWSPSRAASHKPAYGKNTYGGPGKVDEWHHKKKGL